MDFRQSRAACPKNILWPTSGVWKFDPKPSAESRVYHLTIFLPFSEENENELLCMISVVNFLKSRNFCCWFSSIFLTWPVFPSRDKTLRKYVLWLKNNTTDALIAVAGFNTFKHNFNLNFIHRTWNVREIVLSENQFIVRKLTAFSDRIFK